MARFATYYFRYDHELGPYEWEKRQEHLAALFDKDDCITFGDGEPSEEQKRNHIPYAKVFNHRVYHLKINRNIFVMQFANSIDIPVESKFEQTIVKDEPSLFVIVDNRKDIRTVAIQNRRKAFSAPRKVAQIMENQICSALFGKYCYSVKLLPEFYPADLFKAWHELQQNSQSLRLVLPDTIDADEIMQKANELKDKDYYDNSLMPMMLQLALEAKKAKYRQPFTVMPEDKKNALYVDKSTIYMKNFITLASASGAPVDLITSDGAVFKCFVEPEEDDSDKIVHRKFDESLLEMLFKGRKANGEKAGEDEMAKVEADIVEMLNGMKHTSEDIEKKEDAA